jgi:hypothetical protein
MKKTLLPLFFAIVFNAAFGQVFNGLIGKYTFDNGTADDVAGTNNGSVMGAVPTTDRFGNASKAFYFNGTSDYILLPQTAVPNFNTINAITISAWIKPDDVNSGLRTIVGKWNGTTTADQFLFTQDGNDNFMAVRSVNSAGFNDNSNSLTAGNWHHVVFMFDKFDNNRHIIYVDGMQVYNNTFGGFFTTTSNNTFTCIGAQYGDVNGASPNIQRYFKGAIDDIQIFDRTLVLSEVQQLFNAPPPYDPNTNNGLISKYSFNFGNTLDEVGSNNALEANTTLVSDRFGNTNLARGFNGTNSNMFIYNNPSINLDAITLSTWINPTNTASGLRTIIGKWNNDATSEQYLLAQDGAHLVIAIKGINSLGTSVIANLTPGTWYHIVYTYSKADNNRQKVYVNNVEVFNSTFGGTYTNTSNSTNLSFGVQYGDLNNGAPSFQRFFNGAIDDIHIYNRVITVAQVDSLYTIPNPITPCVPTSSSLSVSTCAPYIAPDGQSYSGSGNITAIIPNAAGCDSTISVALTILSNTFSIISPIVCANYTAPDGQTYTTSGTYLAVIPNQAGCDSTITINLLVNNSTNTLTVSTCGSYLAPNSQTYTSSGVYTAIIPNQAGCDSIITINLQVNTSTSSTLNITSCDAYIAPDGNTYVNSGTYQMTIPNQTGCDSLITLNLTMDFINSSITVINFQTLSVLDDTGLTYQWVDCDNGNSPISGATNPQFTPSSSGNYAAVITNSSCSSTTLCTFINVSNPTGIVTEQSFLTTIYPNPTKDQLTIELNHPVEITLVNVLGELVLKTHLIAGINAVDVSSYPSGIYFIQVTNQDGSVRPTKFIKE